MGRKCKECGQDIDATDIAFDSVCFFCEAKKTEDPFSGRLRIGSAKQMQGCLGEQLSLLRSTSQTSSDKHIKVLDMWLRDPRHATSFKAAKGTKYDHKTDSVLAKLVELPSIGPGGLSSHSVGGFWDIWIFGFTGRQRHILHSAANACGELVVNAIEMLKNREPETLHLVKTYMGEASATKQLKWVINDYESLKKEITSKNPAVLFYPGSDGDAVKNGNGRTCAYIDSAGILDDQLAGDFCQKLQGRCVFLPDFFFQTRSTEDVSESLKHQRLLRGATILHELFHITSMVKGDIGENYGRVRCMKLGANPGEAQENADTWSYLALDLMLLKQDRNKYWDMVLKGYRPDF